MNADTTTLRLDDIDDVEPSAVELSAEEIRAISGAQKSWHVTYYLKGLAAEWILR